MQCCQHCGSKSWAPPDSQPSNHYVTDDGFDVGESAENILICDGCGEWGLKSVIDGDTLYAERLPPPHIPPSQLDSLAAQLQMFLPLFQSFLPKPETRLERLVKAALVNGLPPPRAIASTLGDFAQHAIAFARALEVEIDREELLKNAPPPTPAPDADFGMGEGA